MSASKPLLVLLVPAFLAVPCSFANSASAQEKTAPNAPATVSDASLTKTASPATTIAPRQSLPAFTSVKLSVSPVLAAPTTAGQTLLTPPVTAKASAIKEAALPAPTIKMPVASWSAPGKAQLVTSQLALATPPIAKQRRAYAAAVSLSTSPGKSMELTPQVSVAPATTVAAPVSVTAIAPLTAPVAQQVARPSILASREARAREVALARMDAQLAGAEGRLDRAQSKLTEGQRQLGSVSNLLQSAMLSSGGSGLHPFVRVAQRYLGTPYVWGGESARGFDCSGFIMRVMRDLGYQALPHSAAEQFNYGQPISKGLLQPGDIVFFANTYKPGISHVGIYLGGGRFIHAANSQVGTIESNLNSPKWVAHYAGARRLMKMG